MARAHAIGSTRPVASSWIAWRNAGKFFYSKEDIAAVRGISLQELEVVYLIIWDSDTEEAVSHDKSKEDKKQIHNSNAGSTDENSSEKSTLIVLMR